MLSRLDIGDAIGEGDERQQTPGYLGDGPALDCRCGFRSRHENSSRFAFSFLKRRCFLTRLHLACEEAGSPILLTFRIHSQRSLLRMSESKGHQQMLDSSGVQDLFVTARRLANSNPLHYFELAINSPASSSRRSRSRTSCCVAFAIGSGPIAVVRIALRHRQARIVDFQPFFAGRRERNHAAVVVAQLAFAEARFTQIPAGVRLRPVLPASAGECRQCRGRQRRSSGRTPDRPRPSTAACLRDLSAVGWAIRLG